MSDGPAIDIDKFCAACGYNLRGIASDRCPECGAPHDPNQSMAPQIPWSHRRTLGRRRAFWRTVKLATFRTKTFASEINRPVSLADAKSFRTVVVLHAWLIIAPAAAWGYLEGLGMLNRPWQSGDHFGSIHQWIGLPVMLASIWLFLVFVTGGLSYFYHPGELPMRQQNRAVALSYYAYAPWAYLFIVPLMIGILALGVFAGINPDRRNQTLVFGILVVVSYLPIVLLALVIWFKPQAILYHCTHCSWAKRALLVCVIQPLLYLLSALLALGLINLAYWGLGLMIVSLR